MYSSHQMPSSANLPLASISGGIEASLHLSVVEMSPSAPRSAAFFFVRLSLPPGLNQSYQVVKVPKKRSDEKKQSGEMVYRIGPTAELEQFKERAGWELTLSNVDWEVVEAIRQSHAKRKYVPLFARIKFYYPTMWKVDFDSGVKHVVDVIFKHLGLNDTLITDSHITKDVYRPDPHVEIELSCILDK